MSAIDYIAHIEFMWYRGEFVPRHIVFAGVARPDELYSIKPTPDSLIRFGWTDIRLNLQLPYKVYEDVTDREAGAPVSMIAIQDMDVCVKEYAYQTLLNRGVVGVVDMMTYMYLQKMIPVVYLGPSLIPKANNPKCVWVAMAVSEELRRLARHNSWYRIMKRLGCD